MTDAILNNLLLTHSTAHINTREACIESNKLLVSLFKEIVLTLSPAVFFEIGARQADVSFDLSSKLPNTHFICFEANKYSFDVFNKRFHNKSNVEYLHTAVSNYDGQATIKIPKGTNPDLLVKGNASLSLREQYEEGYVEHEVPCVRLDSFCTGISLEKGACAWIDVEGHFQAVAEGASNTLAELDVIFIEVEEKPFWQGQILASEIFNLLCANNMTAIARDSESRFFQYNVIFIKSHLIDLIKPQLKIFLDNLAKLK